MCAASLSRMRAIRAISALRRDAAFSSWIAAAYRKAIFSRGAHAGFWRSNSAPAPGGWWSIAARRDRSCRLGHGAARHRRPFHPDPGGCFGGADFAAGPCPRSSGPAPHRRTQPACQPTQRNRHGWMVEAAHDAYVPQFGLIHERRITMSPQGLMVTGADRLVAPDAKRGEKHPSARWLSPCAFTFTPMCGCRGWKAAASCSSCRAGRLALPRRRR